MSQHDDFKPTRRAAYEFSERSIEHSREFMSHPEAVQALGELAPRIIEVLDSLYIPETSIDSDGTLVVNLPHIVGPRDVPIISAAPETPIRLIRNAPFTPDEKQREAMQYHGQIILDSHDPRIVDEIVDDVNRFDEDPHERNFRFSKLGGLAASLIAYSDTYAVVSSPVLTLNMHTPEEMQANPYVLLHEALHAGDILNEPLVDLRKNGYYRHLLRYELRGYYVSATVLELQRQHNDIFRQYNASYTGVQVIKTVEETRSRHNDFLGIDKFEPNPSIDYDLRRHHISILGSGITPDTILGR